MEVRDTDIEDVKVFVPRRFEDSRGYFSETFVTKKYAPHLGDMAFVQDNESFSVAPYTVRGLHFQSPPFAQDKLVRVIAGRVLDVVVDVREGSPTFGKWVSAELTAGGGEQIIAPIGFLHAFMTLEPNTVVAYKVSNFYDSASDGGVMWNSPSLKIDWPVGADKAVLSDKDSKAIDYDDFDSPFTYNK